MKATVSILAASGRVNGPGVLPAVDHSGHATLGLVARASVSLQPVD